MRFNFSHQYSPSYTPHKTKENNERKESSYHEQVRYNFISETIVINYNYLLVFKGQFLIILVLGIPWCNCALTISSIPSWYIEIQWNIYFTNETLSL